MPSRRFISKNCIIYVTDVDVYSSHTVVVHAPKKLRETLQNEFFIEYCADHVYDLPQKAGLYLCDIEYYYNEAYQTGPDYSEDSIYYYVKNVKKIDIRQLAKGK